MQNPTALVLLMIGAVACGSDDKGGSTDPDASTSDAPEGIDASIDAAPAPAMIVITGTAVERTSNGTTPVADAMIAAFRTSDEATPIATATTNAQGAFTMTISTNGLAVDGYLRATKTNLLDSYLYPPAPLVADTVAPVNMISESTLNLINAFAQGNQQAGKGVIALVVVDGATAMAMPVAGAAVTSSPASGAYRYNNSNGLPSSSATSTAADGTAYLFNVPPDVAVTVSATKTGSTFKSHGLKARADKFTTTLITP